MKLKTADGKKVPVIFRPWHEMNGGWFWWGANSCTAYQYNMLYIKTYVTLIKAGCNNIVWAWSPNLGSEKTVEAFLERFPGEQYVDMVENGILDPAKVTRSALQNATSVASTLLTTESVVADIKEDAPAVPAGNPGMGMM